MQYLTGQLVIVYNKFIGRVTNQTKQGIWVAPLITTKPNASREDQNHHSCYSPSNVRAMTMDDGIA